MKQEMKATRSNTESERLRPISSRNNQRLKELRQAFRRGEPTAKGECAIEGAMLIEEAIRSGLHLETVFFSEAGRTLANRLLPQIGARVEALVLPNTLFNSIVPTDMPQGVAAFVKLRAWPGEQIVARANGGPLVVTMGLQDPGNLGTILRSAEAFGAVGVFLTEGTVSLYNWKVLRGSAGSVFRLPCARTSWVELFALLRSHKVKLVATSSHQGTPLPQVEWKAPCAIFVGNEGAGLPREIIRQMDEVVVIPQAASVESLNAGVATSIILYEASKMRAHHGDTEARRHGGMQIPDPNL